MIPRKFFPIASAFSLFSQACNAQTITLTTHVSACSATYTSGTSTTVIQSTVTVQPTPWTDAAANGGAPFVIRLQQVGTSGYPDQDTAPYWLTANGNTTTNSSAAAVYTINEGRLATLNGSHVATNFNVVDQAFGVTDYNLPINTTFSVNDRMLNWTNALFTNGTAQFYQLPPGLLDNALILAKFLGPMEPQRSWSPVILYVEPLINNGTGVVSSSAASGVSGAQLSTVSDSLPSSGTSSVSTGVQVSPMASAASSIGSMSSPLASSMSSDVMPSSMASGMSSGMMTAPSIMESMTSSSMNAVVESSSPANGISASTPLSSSASISGIGPVVVPSSSTTSSPASTSSMPPETTYSCPVNNGETVQSNMGGTYQLGCNEAVSGGGATQRAGTVTNLNDCMTLCDQTSGCTAWTFDGVDSCYIETGTSSSGITFQPSTTQGTVSGIRNVPARPGGTGSASSSASSASSPVIGSTSSGLPIVSSISQSAPSTIQSVSSAIQSVSSAPNAGPSSVAGMSSSVASILSSASPISSSSAPINAPSAVSSASATIISSVVPSSAASIVSSVGVSSSFVPALGGTSTNSASSNAPSSGLSGAPSSNTAGVGSTSASGISSGAGLTSAGISLTGSSPGSAPSPTVQTTYSCPSANGTTVTDANGASYQIMCSSDTTLGGINYGASPDFNGCMTICDSVAGCGGFTYNGNCYLKEPGSGGLQFVPAGSNYVAGIRNGVVGATSTTSSAPSATVSLTSYSCPSVDNQTVTDGNGASYEIKCDSDTTLGGVLAGSSPTFNGCLLYCDASYGCGGFVFTDTGNCYLKNPGSGSLSFVPAADNYVAGIRDGLAYGSGPSPTGTQSTTTSTATNSPPKCPAMNGTTITDSNGAQYSIACGGDSQGTLISVVAANGQGIDGCFAACDSTSGCGAFTYSGDSTMTMGNCYLKQSAGATSSGGADTIALAILVSPATVSVSMYPSTSSTAAAAASSSGGTSSGSGSGSGFGSAASSASGSAAATTPVCTGPPLPSGSGASTVLNPDGSTSTYNGLLPSPTRCDFGDPINTDEDDSYCEIDLPFQVTMYGGSSNATFPSTNGLLTLESGTTDYDSSPGLPNPYIPLYAAAPFFDDLFKSGSDDDQGIFYTYTATAVTYEYRLIRAGTTETYHFTVSYDSTKPGIFVYRYYEVGQDQGSASAAIGIQGSYDGTTQVAVQYSNQRAGAVVVNSTLTCDTATTPATCVLSC